MRPRRQMRLDNCVRVLNQLLHVWENTPDNGEDFEIVHFPLLHGKFHDERWTLYFVMVQAQAFQKYLKKTQLNQNFSN